MNSIWRPRHDALSIGSDRHDQMWTPITSQHQAATPNAQAKIPLPIWIISPPVISSARDLAIQFREPRAADERAVLPCSAVLSNAVAI
jgi:hypothetical protein